MRFLEVGRTEIAPIAFSTDPKSSNPNQILMVTLAICAMLGHTSDIKHGSISQCAGVSAQVLGVHDEPCMTYDHQDCSSR